MTIAADILADRDVILADWGDTSTLTHGGVTSSAFAILFEEEYQEILDVSSSGPAALAKTEDVSTAIKGDTLTVTSELYSKSSVAYVIEKRMKNPPDIGPGFTRLIFKK